MDSIDKWEGTEMRLAFLPHPLKDMPRWSLLDIVSWNDYQKTLTLAELMVYLETSCEEATTSKDNHYYDLIAESGKADYTPILNDHSRDILSSCSLQEVTDA